VVPKGTGMSLPNSGVSSVAGALVIAADRTDGRKTADCSMSSEPLELYPISSSAANTS
jgi:hypothetical protein